MNKSILSIIIVLVFLNLVPATLFSQHQIGLSFGYGIPYYKANPVNNGTTISTEPNYAYIAEITYKKRWPGILNIGGDLNFINRNVQINQNTNTLTANVYSDNEFSLYYTNIDAFAEFKLGKKVKYYFQIGPALSFMVFSQMDGYTDIKSSNGNGQTIKTFNTGDATDYFPTISAYIYTAAGIDYPINENWYLSGKFQFQYQTAASSKATENSYSTRGIYFQLGATFILPGLEQK